jgi:DNA-binding CsgD family transcriptional regulator
VRSAYPDAVRSVLEYGNKDGMIVTAIDPYGVGFYISLHLPEVTKLSEKERARWRMVGAHLAAGFRLRRGLDEHGAPTADRGVDEAEAILDPRSFSLAHAKGPALNADARERLRDAAVRLDRARGSLRKSDPEKSLEAWWALLHGRWSLVDWFDIDGRRFVLAHPNPPNVGDPRGLTQREAQVVAFAALGESQKLIRYRIGVSESLVSRALASAMHKLGVTTQAQLVEKLRGVPAVA